MQKACETIKLKEQHGEAIKRLETLESTAINSLSTTMAAKNVAMTTLNIMSPSLRRSIYPRRAYKFRQTVDSDAKWASEMDATEQ